MLLLKTNKSTTLQGLELQPTCVACLKDGFLNIPVLNCVIKTEGASAAGIALPTLSAMALFPAGTASKGHAGSGANVTAAVKGKNIIITLS